MLEDLKQAFKSARISTNGYLKSRLNEHQKLLLGIVTKHKEITSSTLYDKYNNASAHPLSERGYRLQMQTLRRLGFVRSMGEGRWKRFGTSGLPGKYREVG